MKNKRGRIYILVLKKMFGKKGDVTSILKFTGWVGWYIAESSKSFQTRIETECNLARSFIYVKTVCTIHLSGMIYLFVNVIHDWRDMCSGWIYCLRNVRTLIIFQMRGTILFPMLSLARGEQEIFHVDLHMYNFYCTQLFPRNKFSVISFSEYRFDSSRDNNIYKL